ncbi:MAG: hypothetical protein P9X24_08060 [Candidatus Hatepunaea meridiana]|nr:hypothetical protein [Candidatus Hatepunaea meridiana]
MFCDKCQIEIEPMLDQWNNKRCPKCKQMLTAPSGSSDDSGDKDSSDKTQNSESSSPAYTEFLKKTDKFRRRKKLKKRQN